MKTLFKLIIVATILYAIIAFISWNITWITYHWFFRAAYLIITMLFTTVFSHWEEGKR